MSVKLKRGSSFGQWVLIENVGSGGSSVVWKAEHDDGRQGAMKFLKAAYLSDPPRLARFKNEVAAMKACSDIPGVLPLWDWSIPEQPRTLGEAWLVSPFAEPLPNRTLETLDDAVAICLSLAQTLSQMHPRGYSHRDIKPPNVFYWGERWNVGDLGIAAGPDISRHTQQGEKLGPAFYIAPEMLNDAVDADGRRADVYSLGKLLWKLATGQKYPLPGMQPRYLPAVTISGALSDPRAFSLDALIDAATQSEPEKRPTAAEFERALAAWNSPTPVSDDGLDLSSLTRRAAELVQPHKNEETRRRAVEHQAEEARGRFFKAFAVVMNELRDAMKLAQIGNVAIASPSGGNAHFADDGATSGRRFFQFSVDLEMRDNLRRVVLRGGVNLGMRERAGENGSYEDIYSPALAFAGYALEIDAWRGSKQESSRLCLWRESKEFLLGAPDQSAATASMIAGLRENLRASVEAMLDAFEDLGRQ